MNNLATTEQKMAQAVPFRDDEIDLFDLINDVVQNKVWVLLSVVLCVTLAVAYLAVAKPVFESTSVIKPAAEKDLLVLNPPQLDGVFSMNASAAYGEMKKALQSKELRQKFFQVHLAELKEIDGLYSENISLAQNFSAFDKRFNVEVSTEKDTETFLQITLELSDAEKSADLLNQYVDFAIGQKKQEISETIDSKTKAQVKTLEYDVMLKREQYFSSQTRRKLELDEAKGIAKAVGQTDPVYFKSDLLGTYQPPLYMYGTRAIIAEETALDNRKLIAKKLPHGEDHFIPGLPDLLFKIQQLGTVEIDFNDAKLVAIDEIAIAPLAPIKPRKMLVVALATVAGLFLGFMLALLMAAYKRRKLAHI